MKKNIVVRTNALVCLILLFGFLLISFLSYRANYSASIETLEQVSALTSEGIYYQLATTFTKPLHISMTMANDSLLKELLAREPSRLTDQEYLASIKKYLSSYQKKYAYDSVFLVSSATGRYYNFNGLDRILKPGNPENTWYYAFLDSGKEHELKVDNDEVAGASNDITVFINCKIKNDSGKVIGVVGVGLRIDSLQSLLKQYESEFGVNAYLINQSGIIEVSSEHTGFESVSFFERGGYDETVQKNILDWKESEDANRFWAKGKDAGKTSDFIVTRYLQELSWHLVIERDTAALLQSLNRRLVLTAAVIAAVILLILVVITYVIRGFNRRIVELTKAKEQERRCVFEQATEGLFDNIYELNITNNRPADNATKQYFKSLGVSPDATYDESLQWIAERQIKKEYRRGYLDTFCTKNVLRAFQEGRETLKYEFLIREDTSGYYWMRITARIVRLESDGTIHMLAYRQNIDEEKRREAQMEELAQTDEMTGLLTKTATQRNIEGLLEQGEGKQYAFFLFDIDHFKMANDQFGHAFGDGVIHQFTKIIRTHFPSQAVMGRIGGDEFVVFLSVPDLAWVKDKADELSQALSWTYREDGKRWDVSASIGIAVTNSQQDSFDTLYRHADASLYKAKQKGRNGYHIFR